MKKHKVLNTLIFVLCFLIGLTLYNIKNNNNVNVEVKISKEVVIYQDNKPIAYTYDSNIIMHGDDILMRIYNSDGYILFKDAHYKEEKWKGEIK